MLNDELYFDHEENISGKRKARKSKRAARRKTRKKKVGAIKKKVVSKTKKVGKVAALIPFKLPMIAVLRAKKITPEKDLSDLARQFYTQVVMKDQYETELDFESGQNVATDLTFMQEESIEPLTISAIVSGIISFFKSVKAKKEAGKPLTKTQQVAYNVGAEAEKQGTQMAIDEVEEGIGETVTGAAGIIKNNIAIIIGIVAVGVGFYLYKNK